MAIITLTTDLGTKDHYVGVLKGTILSYCPDAVLIDITHEIPVFNISKAAFALKNSYTNFPAGSIHIIDVNSEVKKESLYVVIAHKGHYFIGLNNGVFSLLFEEQPEKVMELNLMDNFGNSTFPTKDVFAKAACHLAKEGTMEMIGKPMNDFLEKSTFRAVSAGNIIKGMAIHIDHYGNVITNIEETFFKTFGQGRNFLIEFKHRDYNINSINKAYNDVAEGERLAFFSSSGYLEIALNKGNASKLLGIKESDLIRIEFYGH